MTLDESITGTLSLTTSTCFAGPLGTNSKCDEFTVQSEYRFHDTDNASDDPIDEEFTTLGKAAISRENIELPLIEPSVGRELATPIVTRARVRKQVKIGASDIARGVWQHEVKSWKANQPKGNQSQKSTFSDYLAIFVRNCCNWRAGGAGVRWHDLRSEHKLIALLDDPRNVAEFSRFIGQKLPEMRELTRLLLAGQARVVDELRPDAVRLDPDSINDACNRGPKRPIAYRVRKPAAVHTDSSE
jgi:hypothetical protein